MGKEEQWEELSDEDMATLLRSLNPFATTLRNLGEKHQCVEAVVSIYGPVVRRVQVKYHPGIRKKEMRDMINGR